MVYLHAGLEIQSTVPHAIHWETYEDSHAFVVWGLGFDFAGTRRLSAPGGHLVGPGDMLPTGS